MNRALIAILILLPSVIILLVVLSGIRNYDEDSFVSEINSNAQSVFEALNNYITEMQEDGEDAPFRDTQYSAVLKPRSGSFEVKALNDANDKIMLSMVILNMDPRKYENDMYYVFEVRQGEVRELSACRKDILDAEDLRPVRRDQESGHISLIEYYLKRYIAYYPG